MDGMTRIFISYRRDDAEWAVERIHAALKPHVSDPRHDIFVDVDNIPAGVDFAEYLDAKVTQCDVLLAVIGPNWLGSRDPRTGGRRLDDANDFVRFEIATALRRKIKVAPVLLNGARLPEPQDLPEEIRGLVGRQGVSISLVNFEADAQRLIQSLGLRRRAATEQARSNGAASGGRLVALSAIAVAVLAIGSVAAYGYSQSWFGAPPETASAPSPAASIEPIPAPTAADPTTDDPAEAAAWRMADSVRSAQAYEAYLASYPKGAHANVASVTLARISDDTDWSKASGGNRTQLNQYLADHPLGIHANSARTQLATLDKSERDAAAARSEAERQEIERRAAEQREADRVAAARKADENAWALARSANSAAAFQAYLNLYPDGLFADQARREIAASTPPAPSRPPAGDSLDFPNKPTQ
jgi:hypothetical protein